MEATGIDVRYILKCFRTSPCINLLLLVTVVIDDYSYAVALKRLALIAAAVLNLPVGFRISPEQSAWTYRRRLADLGLLKGRGSFRLPEIGQGYFEHVQPLRRIPELSGLPDSPRAAVSQLAPLLYGSRDGGHPLRHLTAVAWLFGSLDAFLSPYETTSCPLQLPPRSPTQSVLHVARNTSEQRKQLTSLLANGMSVSGAATSTGIDVSTAMAWAASCGIESPRRPKKLKSPLRDQLIAALRLGVDKELAASAVDVSVGTVTRILRTEVGLYHEWLDARFLMAQSAARDAWESVRTAHPLLRPKALRMLEPAAYAWLYRHDRSWLLLGANT